MLNFNLHTTTEIVFGKDIEEQIGPRLKELGAHRILVHFGGSSARTSGLLDRVEKSLFAAGLAFVELGGVSPNPKVSLVRKGIALAEREGIDFVLAVGGGSVIDSAKAIAMGVATKTDPWQFASTGTKPDTTLPVGTVLTLAARKAATPAYSPMRRPRRSAVSRARPTVRASASLIRRTPIPCPNSRPAAALWTS